MENYEKITHELEPIYNENSKILILGTLPSVKSREQQFFYAHPQNRFWKVLASVTENDVPVTIDDKKDFLLRNNIAVWDVIESCQIIGSSDNSIKDVVPTDITRILETANITKIFANGAKAMKLYDKYQYKELGIKIEGLPSTSPANAAYSLEKLVEKWSIIKKYI